LNMNMGVRCVGDEATSAAEVATGHIRQLITTGELAAGEVLREDDLAARLGMSRTPLREAIARLETEGLVVSRPHRSAVVFKPSADDLREIYEMRIALESLAARLATERAGPDDVAELQRLWEELDETPPGRGWVRRNRAFHLRLYRVSGRDRLLRMIENLRDQSEPYVRMFVVFGHGSEAQEDHRRLIDAVRAGDSDKAARATAEHLTSTMTTVMAELEAEGD
jgi:DNA-binding GntR family transcriptional regulator